MLPRYPIYVPSKGRHDRRSAFTLRALAKYGVPFRLVVEPAEADSYAYLVSDRDRMLVLPENGFGLLRARNWIRDHAEAEGHGRHWQLDDNISIFYRIWEAERIPICAGTALRVCEDLTDRFENVGISGLNYTMFASPTSGLPRPFTVNCHVYSCTLINHRMPYRWRLKYNDDTDICLQALTHGWATILVSAVNAQKLPTMVVAGGNTDDLYRDNPGAAENVEVGTDTFGRYRMARSLERMWPSVVKVTRRFDRYQHSVNWAAFETVPLVVRSDVDLDAFPDVDEYGLELRVVRPDTTARVLRVAEDYERALGAIPSPHRLWRGLPAFRPTVEPPRLTVRCRTEEDRSALVEKLGVAISKKTRGTLSAWWPPRERGDFAALRFEPKSEGT